MNTHGMIIQIQPILILQDTAEDTLIIAKKQERREAAVLDGQPQGPTATVPVPHCDRSSCYALSDGG